MRDYSKLTRLAEKNNGYIFSGDLIKENIAKDYLKFAANDGLIEKITRGVYILSNNFTDFLFVFQKTNNKVIYSAYTSAYLLDLTTRDCEQIYASIPKSYNPHHLKQYGIFIREDFDLYELGVTNVTTNFGNMVKCHDIHRTICDLFNPRYLGDKFVQIEALKNYINSQERDMTKLMSYAKKLGVDKDLRARLEVLL